MNIAIVGYKSSVIGPWGPSDITTGLPGSEEAVVYLDRALRKLGHRVDVYIDPNQHAPNNWFDCQQYQHSKIIYDWVIAWRLYDPSLKIKAKRIAFWPHDLPGAATYSFTSFDLLLFLSKAHHRYFQQRIIGTYCYGILGNGCDLTHFSHPKSFTNKYSIGYYSNYTRGLRHLLVLWPELKARYPSATLDIYYGRETWDNSPIGDIIAMIEDYKDLDVIEHGMIGHQQLALAMQQTSVWAYPCVFPETFCITAIKAQAAGAIPVTTRLAALQETVVPSAPTVDNIVDYRDTLFDVLEHIDDYDKVRDDAIEFAKAFSWDIIAKRLTKFLAPS